MQFAPVLAEDDMTPFLLIGGAGLWATPHAAAAFKQTAGSIFPIFAVSQATVIAQALCAATVGVTAAIVPAVQAARVRIVEGLRAVG